MIAGLIPLAIIAIIIFLIAGIMESKTTEKKSSIIRSVYFYLTSLVTLAIVVGSLVFLFNIGFKTWVFPEAESVHSRLGPPSTLYLDNGVERVDRIEPELAILSCDEECTLTAREKSNIDNWAANYITWQEAEDNPNANLYDELAAALSFLIVALPFFIIHFRIVQKDARKEEDHDKQVIRPTYFYFIALAALIMIVVSGGMLINIGLKTWVFPEANNANKYIESPQLAFKGSDAKAPVQSLIDCGEKCKIDAETITMAEQWIVDYEEWENFNYQYNNNQRQAAAALPYLIVGIPLFWYHWNIARSKKKKQEKIEEVNN